MHCSLNSGSHSKEQECQLISDSIGSRDQVDAKSDNQCLRYVLQIYFVKRKVAICLVPSLKSLLWLMMSQKRNLLNFVCFWVLNYQLRGENINTYAMCYLFLSSMPLLLINLKLNRFFFPNGETALHLNWSVIVFEQLNLVLTIKNSDFKADFGCYDAV